MRKVLMVLGHGRQDGLVHHLADVVRGLVQESGAELRVHDLLADGFDPVLRLAPGERHAPRLSAEEDPLVHRYQEDVAWADAYVIVHPVWWFGPPALLKGWVDRVLVEGVALEHRPGANPAPLLGGRRALVVQTFNAKRAIDLLLFRGVSTYFWRRAVFLSVGVEKVERFALYEVEGLTTRDLEQATGRLARAAGALLD